MNYSLAFILHLLLEICVVIEYGCLCGERNNSKDITKIILLLFLGLSPKQVS